jgi:hypothetical protein
VDSFSIEDRTPNSHRIHSLINTDLEKAIALLPDEKEFSI